MMRVLQATILFAFAWNGAACAQTPVDEQFRSDELDWAIWCPCQIDMDDSPIGFPLDPDEAGDRMARITVNASSIGGNNCKREDPDECRPPSGSPALTLFRAPGTDYSVRELPEPFGPSFIRRPRMELLDVQPRKSYCDDDAQRRAGAAGEEGLCIQRQELRFQTYLQHKVSKPTLYAFRFRMPKEIDNREDSIRWILAQWKHKPIHSSYCPEEDCEWGPSPFLAQRFDDGVLHVTVQDEHCRCIVASAPDPNNKRSWVNGRPGECLWTGPDPREGEQCTADLRILYGDNPVLDAPLGEWVEMRYRVQAGRSGSPFIEIHQNGRFIARVTGKIGYRTPWFQTSDVKFKIGQYREYMPFTHEMDIDWLTVTPAAE